MRMKALGPEFFEALVQENGVDQPSHRNSRENGFSKTSSSLTQFCDVMVGPVQKEMAVSIKFRLFRRLSLKIFVSPPPLPAVQDRFHSSQEQTSENSAKPPYTNKVRADLCAQQPLVYGHGRCKACMQRISSGSSGNQTSDLITVTMTALTLQDPEVNSCIPAPSVFYAQYDCQWTTGVPDNGNDWRKFRVVPRSYPLRPLIFYFV